MICFIISLSTLCCCYCCCFVVFLSRHLGMLKPIVMTTPQDLENIWTYSLTSRLVLHSSLHVESNYSYPAIVSHPWGVFRFVSENKLSVKTFRPNNYTPGWVWLPKNTEWNQIVCSKKLARLETDWSSIRPRKKLQP